MAPRRRRKAPQTYRDPPIVRPPVHLSLDSGRSVRSRQNPWTGPRLVQDQRDSPLPQRVCFSYSRGHLNIGAMLAHTRAGVVRQPYKPCRTTGIDGKTRCPGPSAGCDRRFAGMPERTESIEGTGASGTSGPTPDRGSPRSTGIVAVGMGPTWCGSGRWRCGVAPTTATISRTDATNPCRRPTPSGRCVSRQLCPLLA